MAGRVSRVAVEVVVEPDGTAARVSQLAIEAVARPEDARGRVSQVAVEVLRQKTSAPSPPRVHALTVG